jgi:hypothetical protein
MSKNRFHRAFVRTLPLLTYILIVAKSADAGYEWGFADVNLNHLAWDGETKQKSTKTDFNYLELEGGGQFTWGELYGFFDIENIDRRSDQNRSAEKGVIRYYLGKSHFSLYGHVYNFTDLGFSEQNRVYGLGYQLEGHEWWVKPFLGIHDVTQTYFTGYNGFMGGWVVGYGFHIHTQDFLFSDWHEIEFARRQAYADGNGGKRTSQNGAAALWWIATPHFTYGIQWRYALDKLGTPGLENAAIATIKYVF